MKKPKHKHKTFSLLPDTLMPYNRISIDLMIYILQTLSLGNSLDHTIEKIDSMSPHDIFLSEKILHHFFDILEQTRIKLIHFYRQYNNGDRAPPDAHKWSIDDTIQYLLKYPLPNYEHPIKGAYYLSVLYYTKQGSYQSNARFLFGTASQFSSLSI